MENKYDVLEGQNTVPQKAQQNIPSVSVEEE